MCKSSRGPIFNLMILESKKTICRTTDMCSYVLYKNLEILDGISPIISYFILRFFVRTLFHS